MTYDKMNILEIAKKSYDIIIKNFSEQDQKLISEIFNLNKNSTYEDFEDVGLKKDNFIVIKNKNNEDIEYKNYDNEITKVGLLGNYVVEGDEEECGIFEIDCDVFFTKKGIIIEDKEGEFTKIEKYSGNLAINLISEIFKTDPEYFVKETKLLYSNLLKCTSQNTGDIDVNELQNLISRNNYDKNEKALSFIMEVIARSGENIEAFKFLFNNYFNDKESKLKLVKDIFTGGNPDMIHILELNLFQQLTPEEKFQFAFDALIGACESGKPEVLGYVLENYSDCLNLKGKENEKSEIVFEAFKIACVSKNKKLFKVFLSEYEESKILNTIILGKKKEINELFKKIENPEIANLLLNKLLEIGFDFDTSIKNDKADDGIKHGTETILHYAFENENLEIAKFLLDQLPDKKLTELANIKNEYGSMLFNYDKITKKENLEIVKLLFSIKDFDINAKPESLSKFPIYSALENNNIELFKFLLNNPNIDVNRYNHSIFGCYDDTVLRYILRYESDDKPINTNEMLKLLLIRPELEIGITYDNEKLTEFLEESEDDELKRLIINHPNFDINGVYGGLTILQYFIKENRKDIVELLLKNKKLDVNEIFCYKSALYLAVKLENEGMVKLLINNDKVDVNRKGGEYGKDTPLRLAVELENEGIVKLLVDNDKIDLNEKDWYGRTVLELTIEKRNERILRILLSNKNIDVNLVENKKDEITLLNNIIFNYECRLSFERELSQLTYFTKNAISLILNHENLDPNLEYNKSYTLLSRIIRFKDVQLIDFLLSQPKIKEDMQKGDGVRLLNKAIETGKSEIAGLLISKDEINLNTLDENGKTAIQFAISSGKGGILIKAIKNAKELIKKDSNTLDEASKKIKEEKLKLLEEIENKFSGEKQMSIL